MGLFTIKPIAYINIEERKLEWATPIQWQTPTIARMDKIALYTEEQLEEARKQGMRQERALWELSAIGQEIDK
jgi:hypothetical protein